MSSLIGYYVHHQGQGHRHRALAIARHSPDRFVLIGTGLQRSRGGPRCIALDDDLPDPNMALAPASPDDVLHYAPLGHQGIRRRIAAMSDWIACYRPALVVVDVSVEIAMLARLTSTAFAYMRLGGVRIDPAHLEAFRTAHTLLAPFHEDLDDPMIPEWVRLKTRYVPGLTAARRCVAPRQEVVVVVNGSGGGLLDGHTLAAAAAGTPHLLWRVIGPATEPVTFPANLRFLGWVANADEEIAGAGVVVGSAGDGIASAVFAAGRPYVCMPQDRPYHEQSSRASRMAALGAAIVLEGAPLAAAWPGILDRARRLNPAAGAHLHRAEGTRQLADLLLQVADGVPCPA